jgi:hypothetical protein
MPEERKSSAPRSGSAIKISQLVRPHGITRDQARRLINRIGKNRAKLDQVARILKEAHQVGAFEPQPKHLPKN